MNAMEQCPVCGKRGIFKQVCYDPTAVFYECPVCGRYEYSMENNAYEELDYNELAPFLFYEGFRNQQGRELNTGIILQNQENGVIHIQWNLEMIIILQKCQSIWIRKLFHCGFQKVFLKKLI